MNASTLSIGSVQQSILTVPQFQSLNGDCWRLMDGSSIIGTDLSNITSLETLPDAVNNNAFIRQAG